MTRPPAPTSALAPSACIRAPARRAVTDAPLRASRSPAYSASPPLSPVPARTTTRAPYTPPALSRSSPAQTEASPAAARCMSAPSGTCAINAASAARTLETE